MQRQQQQAVHSIDRPMFNILQFGNGSLDHQLDVQTRMPSYHFCPPLRLMSRKWEQYMMYIKRSLIIFIQSKSYSSAPQTAFLHVRIQIYSNYERPTRLELVR
jgi:hypothetical protein